MSNCRVESLQGILTATEVTCTGQALSRNDGRSVKMQHVSAKSYVTIPGATPQLRVIDFCDITEDQRKKKHPKQFKWINTSAVTGILVLLAVNVGSDDLVKQYQKMKTINVLKAHTISDPYIYTYTSTPIWLNRACKKLTRFCHCPSHDLHIHLRNSAARLSPCGEGIKNNQLKATVYALATSHSREVETSARNPGIVQVEVKEARYDCRALLFVHDVSMLFCFFAFDAGRRLRQKTQRTTHEGHCRAT